MFQNKKNNILFVVKIKFSNIYDDIKYIKNLNKVLESYFKNRNAKYNLLVVLSKEDYPEKEIKQIIKENIENVILGEIESFANDGCVDVSGDILGWYKLLKSYIKAKP